MKPISRALLCVLALLLAVSLASCAASRPVYASPRATRAVATAGDVKILYEELYFITMHYIKELEALHGENALENEALRQELEDFVWSSLISRDTALISLGYEYGLDVYKGDIADSVQDTMDSVLEENFGGDRAAYIENLAEMYMTDHYARKFYGVENHLANAIVLEMIYRGEMETDNAKIMQTIKGDSFIRTTHVFIDKSNAAYTEAEHRAHAAQIRAEVAAAATDDARYDAMFEAIGGKYNNDFGDPLANGYYFTHGEMDEAYENAAFALAEYQVSDVIETADGYYVIMRLPKNDSYIEKHFESLRDKAYFVTLNQKVEERLQDMSLSKTHFGSSLDLTALPAIDPDGGSTAILVIAVCAGAVLLGGFAFAFFKFRKKRVNGGK